MAKSLRVLILEDRPADAEIAVCELRQAGFDPGWLRVDTREEFLANLTPAFDVILADYSLPQFNARHALQLLQERELDTPFIIVSGSLSEEVAVDCLKQGATDYLLKDRLTRLGPAVHRALEQRRICQEKKRAEVELRASEQRFRLLAEHASDVISRHSADGRFLYVSPACRTLLGYAADELIGQPADVFCVAEDRAQILRAYAVLHETEGAHTRAYRVHRKNGDIIWLETTWRRFAYPKPGSPLEVHAISRDISERKHAEQALHASLSAKEILLKELQHRVKNNLQVISSLLNLQSAHVKDEQARCVFRESQNRVKSIALVHEKFYHSPDLGRMLFADYVRTLVLSLFQCYGVDLKKVAFQLCADEVFLNLDTAIPCALVINELVSNALKHAFPQGRHGTLAIDLHADAEQRLNLQVRDDGVGLPPHVDVRKSPSLGLQLVCALADQLDANLEVRNGQGTAIALTFKQLSYKMRS
jgi:PAS domain S-box-containing protein